MNHIGRLRKVVNMPIKNEWLDRDPFQKFKSSFIKNNRQILTSEELETIEQKELKIERLQYAKDLYSSVIPAWLTLACILRLNTPKE